MCGGYSVTYRVLHTVSLPGRVVDLGDTLTDKDLAGIDIQRLIDAKAIESDESAEAVEKALSKKSPALAKKIEDLEGLLKAKDERITSLETTNADQAREIVALKGKIKDLEKPKSPEPPAPATGSASTTKEPEPVKSDKAVKAQLKTARVRELRGFDVETLKPIVEALDPAPDPMPTTKSDMVNAVLRAEFPD